jgi:hypothetical protein
VGVKRGPVIAAFVIGLGLIAAPVVFQMFSRAPKGGDMIEAFTPYMTPDQIGLFQGYMAQIDDANNEIVDSLRPQLSEAGDVDAAEFEADFESVAEFNDEWPAIDADMSDMLDTMDENRDNFGDVTALPEFPLFPWFFAIPGAIIAVVAGLALRGDRAGRDQGTKLKVLAGLGVALILAPAVFQMFTRAPSGQQMIEEFEPLMTRERVQSIQGYFIIMGAMEAELRAGVEPLAEAETDFAPGDLPAIAALHEDWAAIFTDFAPMIGTMSDNVVNYEAVNDLPPFGLFPWFFVIPGVLLIGLAVAAGRTGSSTGPETSSSDPESSNPETVDVSSAANP